MQTGKVDTNETGCELDSFGLGHGLVADRHACNDETSGSIKGGQFLGQRMTNNFS